MLILGATSAAQAQTEQPRISGTFENYFLASEHDGSIGANQAIRYLTLQDKVTSGLRLVLGQLEEDGHDLLDETFVEYGGDSRQWRVGRFRSAFGHSDWSDLYYSGFTREPLLREMALGSNLTLDRLDTGVGWHGGTGAMQYQLELIDAHARDWEPIPMRLNHFVGRLQTYRNNWIIGFDALVGMDRFGAGQTQLYALDWRWSAPHVQTKGEFLAGQAGEGHPYGYYLDIFYHPAGLLRTTFLVRAEGVSAAYSGYSGEYGRSWNSGGASDAAQTDTEEEKGFAQLYTVGIKQILSRYFTLELTRSWGNGVQPARSAHGWALQLVTFTYF